MNGILDYDHTTTDITLLILISRHTYDNFDFQLFLAGHADEWDARLRSFDDDGHGGHHSAAAATAVIHFEAAMG